MIGFVDGQNLIFSHELDLDPDVDSPRKIHDALKKESKQSADFTSIVCVQDDEVIATYMDGDDYDLTDDEEEDSDDEDEDKEKDPDDLHEEDSEDEDD